MIRRMTTKDIPAIQSMASRSFEAPKKLALKWYRKKRLEKIVDEGFSYVVEEKGSPLGAIMGSSDGDYPSTVWVELFIVDIHLQGKGIGRKMINFFEETMRKKKIGQILLFTETLNPEAIRFYKKNDYKMVGKLEFMKPLTRIFFKKILNDKILALERKELEKHCC